VVGSSRNPFLAQQHGGNSDYEKAMGVGLRRFSHFEVRGKL
jgi:hypothetical protein